MDAQKVKDLLADLVKEWGQAQQGMSRMEALYEDSFTDVPHAKGFEIFRTGLGAFIVNRASDHLIVTNEVITCPPRRATQKLEQAADENEKFFLAQSQAEDSQNGEPVNKTLGKLALVYGMGVRKGPFWNEKFPPQPQGGSEEEIEEWKRTSRNTSPFLFAIPDPRQVLFPLDTFPPPYVIEVGKRKVSYIRDFWGLVVPNKKDDEEVDWVEYWDKDERWYLADGEEVLKPEARKNVGGFIPYQFIFAGFGIKGLDLSGRRNPDKFCRGLLRSVEKSLIAITRMATAIDTVVQCYANPRLTITGVDPSTVKWGEGPGSVTELPPGAAWVPMPPVEVFRDMWAFYNDTKSSILEATIAKVLTGARPEGVSSGYMQAILVGEARLIFGDLINNLELAHAEYLGNIGRLLDAIGEKVSIWATSTDSGGKDLEIGPEHFAGYYKVECKLPAISPEEADRQAMLGFNMWRGDGKERFISHRTALEKFAMLPNASEELDQIMIEKALATPEMQRVLALAAVKKWASEELQREVEASTEGRPSGRPEAPPVSPELGLVGTRLSTPTPERPTPPAPPGGPETLRSLTTLGGLGQGGEVLPPLRR